MKTKYPNFNHAGSSAPEPTFVPDHMIRKHWSLQFIEMYHLVICLIFGFFTISLMLKDGILSGITPALFCITFGAATFLSITDNYHYRKIICSAHFMLIAVTLCVLIFAQSQLKFAAMVILQGLLVNVIVFLPKKNRTYYLWCKSIANTAD